MDPLTDGIMDDLQYVDRKSAWRHTHYVGGSHNHSAGTWAPTTTVVSDIPNCVRRADATRQVASVRQIQQRMESVQKDIIGVNDLVLEIPRGYTVEIDDQIQEIGASGPAGPIYCIVSVDNVTFGSRKRLGCRILE